MSLDVRCPPPTAMATLSPALRRLFERIRRGSRQEGGRALVPRRRLPSGGEQQMVAVARGIMAEPKLLMLDELSLGLSPLLTIKLFEGVQKLNADGLTMLLVEQNVRLALAVSDYAYVLSEGRTVLEGPAAEVARSDEVQRAYLGL